MKIGCVLLAGGLARRMGGGDKGFKEIEGRPMIARVLDVVASQVDELVINANGDLSRFAHLGYPVVADSVAGHPGPLAGVLAGMDALTDCDFILSVPTDTPYLPQDLVKRLYEPVEMRNMQIVMAHSGGFDHPVIALWDRALKEDLRHALSVEEVRKLKFWISRYRHESVEWPVGAVDPFFNANSPQDLQVLNP